MGDADRVGRLMFGVLLAVIFSLRRLTGTLQLLLGVVAVALLVTSLIGWSPLYALLRFSTCRPTDVPRT